MQWLESRENERRAIALDIRQAKGEDQGARTTTGGDAQKKVRLPRLFLFMFAWDTPNIQLAPQKGWTKMWQEE
jgi:hypothetical protein